MDNRSPIIPNHVDNRRATVCGTSGCLESENVLAAVLVVADELLALAGAGDGEGVLVLVGDAAGALVAFHGDVAPNATVGAVAGDVQHFLLGGFLACDLASGRSRLDRLFDYFGLRLWFGFGLGFAEHYGVKYGFLRGLGIVAAKEQKWRNSQQNE